MEQPPGFIDKEHPDMVCKLHKLSYLWLKASSTCIVH
jgi:hypothetical protein